MSNTAEQDERMSELKTHKDLDVWKEAMLLAKEVYLLLIVSK